MHLTRPKSSKGRSRPSVNHSPRRGGDTGNISIQNTPTAPKPPVEHNNSSSSSSSRWTRWSHSLTRQSSQPSPGEAVHMLRCVPAAPPALTLNKYKVLPSIEKRQLEVDKKASKLNLSDNDIVQVRKEPCLSSTSRSYPELATAADGHRHRQPLGNDPATEIKHDNRSTGPPGGLLLAIRAPCGRRVQRSFLPTDSLLAVVGGVEESLGTRYQGAVVETMDVPRRSFTDLRLTLAQCGILNRSVLCISQESSSLD